MVAIIVACRASVPDLDPRAETVLARYAPGIRLGARSASVRAIERYRFHPAPYVGLADTAYLGPDGTRGIYLRLDEEVDDGNPRVHPWSRVLEVQLRIDSPTAVPAVESYLTRQLGAPVIRCGDNDVANVHWRALYWRGRGAGVQLHVPVGTWEFVMNDINGPHRFRHAALLTFGALEPKRGPSADQPCP